MGPNSNDKCPYKRQNGEDRDIWGEEDKATCRQVETGVTQPHVKKRLREARKDSGLEPLEDVWPGQQLVFRPLVLELW